MDAAIVRMLTERGRVHIALMERRSWNFAQADYLPMPIGPTITELTVLYHGYAIDMAERPLKRYVVVSFVYKGQESESVMVLEEQVTIEGLLKAADSFLIGLDYEV